MSTNDSPMSVCDAITNLLQQIIDIELIYYQPIKDKYRFYGKVYSELKKELENIVLLLSSRSISSYPTNFILDDGLDKRTRELWTKANDTLLTMSVNKKKFAAKRPKRKIKTSIEQVMNFEDTANRLPFARYMTKEGRRLVDYKADNESVQNVEEVDDEWNKLVVVYEEIKLSEF